MKADRVIGACLILGLTGLLIWGVQAVPSKTVLYGDLTKSVRMLGERLTFAPPPATDRPRLTADQAFTRSTHPNNHITGPNGPDAIFLGVLGTRQELAWGYARYITCGTTYGPIPPYPCAIWPFRDATTGRLITYDTGSYGWTPLSGGPALPTGPDPCPVVKWWADRSLPSPAGAPESSAHAQRFSRMFPFDERNEFLSMYDDLTHAPGRTSGDARAFERSWC